MKRVAVFIYGVVCYAIFFGTFCYFCAWVGNFLVPNTLDGEPRGPLWLGIVIDTGLVALFGVQHTVMARPGFKKWWTQFVPVPAERSTYVLLSSLALILMFVFWRPLGGVIWNVENPAGQAVLYGLFGAGWLTVLITTFLINHFDLFGLRQVWYYLRAQEYKPLGFQTPGPYRFVRHPLYVGWLMAFWFTPTMTTAHLLFAIGTTAYILIAIQYEERDLAHFLGKDYEDYQQKVPMIVPGFRRYKTLTESGGIEANA